MRTLIFETLVLVLISVALQAAPALAAEPATTRPEEREDRAIPCTLDLILPPIQLDAASFSDVIDFLRDVNGANIFVDWKRLEAAHVNRATPITLNLHHVKFARAMEMILDAAGAKEKLVSQVQDGVIIVTTQKGAAIFGDARMRKEVPRWSRYFREHLYRRIPHIQFDKVPLNDALISLRNRMKANIAVDWNAFEKIGVDRQRPVTLSWDYIRCDQAIRLIFASIDVYPIEIIEKDGNIHIAPASNP